MWALTKIEELNSKKKQEMASAKYKLEKLNQTMVLSLLLKLSNDERKHFILKNQKFFQERKLENRQSERHQEHDYAFEIDLNMLDLQNQIRLVQDLAKYVDEFHPDSQQ